jgi:hypothetical protein
MSYYVPVCVNCRNLNKGGEDILNCRAFPEAIPMRIADGGDCDFLKPGEAEWDGKVEPFVHPPGHELIASTVAKARKRLTKAARPQRLTRSRKTRHA